MTTACSTEVLQRALNGDLAPDDELALCRHLDECPHCDAAMERLSGGPAWCRETAEFLPDDAIDQDFPPPRDEWSVVDFSVEYLEPSSDPGVLGRLAGYDVLEVLGRGGMGVVLKGFDPELKRFVAIKALAPHLSQSRLARKRFAREAQAAAAVVHPHVLAIHRVQAGGRVPFLVMPLVAGESLAERLKARGSLELSEALRIGLQAAAGLAAAHEQGLVHRDVKPANILLEKGVERAVLTDFGLARAADDASVTRWGIIAGTPEYMSPEQARGEPLDGRSDLFGLGVVLYEMVTGVSPFRADSTVATLRRLVDETPPALASLNPELPRWFVGIVERLLEKDPSRRFGSAQEVSAMLEACLAHVQQPSVVPLPRSAQDAAGRRSPRRKSVVLALVVGALATGAAWLFGPLFGMAGDARAASEINLRRLTAALLAYDEEHGHLPPAVICGKDGKGGEPHSWRVEILPYLGHKALYDQYCFDEPWDGPNNRLLLAKIPAVFRSPLDARDSENASYFDVTLPPATPADALIADGRSVPRNSTVFSRPDGARWAEIPDGSMNTVALVEAKRGVPWTKPEDLAINSTDPATALGGWYADGWYAGFADGGVRFIPVTTDRANLVGLFTINGGEAVELVRRAADGRQPAAPAPVDLAWVPVMERPLLLDASTGNASAQTATQWRGRFGERFDVQVTGRTNGPVWGTDVYTDDSDIASAAVHAGAIKAGESAMVTVTTVRSPNQFIGSARNGVTSANYAAYPAAYVVQRKSTAATNDVDVNLPRSFRPILLAERLVSPPQTAVAWRGRFGERFDVEVTGQAAGSVWGTDVYTDDSVIAAAAVHAGLIKVGERATVTVTVVKSPASFTGSERNGMRSVDYGDWPSAFLLQRTPAPAKAPEAASPPTAAQWQARFGERFDVTVTGTTVGQVWGTDVYTCDSNIAAAAVHAGLVNDGERAALVVTIVKSPPRHAGTARNGVTSTDWEAFPGSFVLLRK